MWQLDSAMPVVPQQEPHIRGSARQARMNLSKAMKIALKTTSTVHQFNSAMNSSRPIALVYAWFLIRWKNLVDTWLTSWSNHYWCRRFVRAWRALPRM